MSQVDKDFKEKLQRWLTVDSERQNTKRLPTGSDLVRTQPGRYIPIDQFLKEVMGYVRPSDDFDEYTQSCSFAIFHAVRNLNATDSEAVIAYYQELSSQELPSHGDGVHDALAEAQNELYGKWHENPFKKAP